MCFTVVVVAVLHKLADVQYCTADAVCVCLCVRVCVCHLLLVLTTAAVLVWDFVLCEVFVAWHYSECCVFMP